MSFHDLLDETEAQSGSVNLLLEGARAAKERIENMLLLVRRGSGVALRDPSEAG
jgi:hypothetical protein